MEPKKIKALVKLLRAQGVTHYKTPELELNLGPVVSRETKVKVKDEESKDKEIPHKVVELTSLLKLDDVGLLDRLFPDHTDKGDAEESSSTN